MCRLATSRKAYCCIWCILLFGGLYTGNVSAEFHGITPFEFDVSMLSSNTNHLKRAAIVAFMDRGWAIVDITDTFITGTRNNRNILVKISFLDASQIKIEYLQAPDAVKISWLSNLRKDFIAELIDCAELPEPEGLQQ